MIRKPMDSRIFVVDEPAHGRGLEAHVVWAGSDLVVTVGGGSKPHVGCVVLAQPSRSKGRSGSRSASCSVLTIPPHKEEPIARRVAEALCEKLGTAVVVSAGVHEDDLDANGVASYLRLGEELTELLVTKLEAS